VGGLDDGADAVALALTALREVEGDAELARAFDVDADDMLVKVKAVGGRWRERLLLLNVVVVVVVVVVVREILMGLERVI
jgi:hypothetical protein